MIVSIGAKLRQLREEMDITQREVATRINCSPTLISNYELDKRAPDYATLIALCDLYQVTCDYVLGRSQNPQQHHNRPLSGRQKKLLSLFDKLPEHYQQDVLRYAWLNTLDRKDKK
ncbi:MAG: helix-turn-helix domain-containing protein [Firmicutes bacterium]|nr:helix-turn-helix domain-containing protein [Bacillota bacterium]